uniref:Uncharacterized protein n=1 Tax=Cacopsylla melanoneura TaxID=428564 RepID=A0A8D8YKE8_9HEMI
MNDFLKCDHAFVIKLIINEKCLEYDHTFVIMNERKFIRCDHAFVNEKIIILPQGDETKSPLKNNVSWLKLNLTPFPFYCNIPLSSFPSVKFSDPNCEKRLGNYETKLNSEIIKNQLFLPLFFFGQKSV